MLRPVLAAIAAVPFIAAPVTGAFGHDGPDLVLAILRVEGEGA